MIRLLSSRVPLALLAALFVIVGPPLRAARGLRRWVSAVWYLPIVLVDERSARITLLRHQAHREVTEANLNVARIGEVLIARGRDPHREAGFRCYNEVIRAVLPREVPVPLTVNDNGKLPARRLS